VYTYSDAIPVSGIYRSIESLSEAVHAWQYFW